MTGPSILKVTISLAIEPHLVAAISHNVVSLRRAPEKIISIIEQVHGATATSHPNIGASQIQLLFLVFLASLPLFKKGAAYLLSKKVLHVLASNLRRSPRKYL